MSLLTDPPVDPRGPRFAAWLTTVMLLAVLATGSSLLLAAQAVFAVGTDDIIVPNTQRGAAA